MVKPELNHKDLNDYLILPVQRVPRYTMIMEHLYHCTESTHPDKKSISNALNKLRQFADSANERRYIKYLEREIKSFLQKK